MEILKLIYRFFEIDFNLLFVKQVSIFSWIKYVIRIHVQIFINFLNKKNKYNLFGHSLHSDELLTIKTFSASLYDVYSETVGLEIFKNIKNPVIVDVGANIGQFSFSIGKLLKTAKIFTFEPNKNLIKKLTNNTKDFDVKIFNFGLGNKNESLPFYASTISSEWSSFIKPDNSDYVEEVLEIKKGDDILSDLKSVDLLKIDVEGFEYQALEGMEDTLKRTRYLLIESSINRETDDKGSRRLIDLIHSKGFRIYNIGRVYGEGKFKEQGAVDITFVNLNLK